MTNAQPDIDARPGTEGRAFATRAWVRTVSTVLRLGLAVLWLTAGALKVGAAAGMVRSVRAFRILPEGLVHPVAYAVPFVEIALGVLLLLGVAVRACAWLSSLMLAAYLAAIASPAARGLRIDCGCFSSGGDLAQGAPTHYTSELVRDSLLLLASGLLTRWPGGYLALDRLLDGPAARGPAAHAGADDPDGWDDDAAWDDDGIRDDDGARDDDAAWRGRATARAGRELAGGPAGRAEALDDAGPYPRDGRPGRPGRETPDTE